MATANLHNLADLRVLITRPADRSAELQAALAAAGASVLVQPLLTISPLAADTHAAELQRSRQQLMNLDNYQHLIFISVNAVHYGLALIEQFWPQWPMGVKVHAIGAATAAALRARDIVVEDVDDAAMNSESLLAKAGLQQLAKQKVLIVRGLGGREYLAEQLSARGAQVGYAECYQRSSPEIDGIQFLNLLRQHQINMVCVNSGETLLHFSALLGDIAQEYPVIVPSERVAAMAVELGLRRIIQAENAGTPATLAALHSYVSK
ncbi:MAG: uroporphyrinogen-III synthase [Zhongshania sp.]|uniref:uroporphyrinogen-III synthase n=1 Tax=Zhongshania sp. TaxID=1971902 RepID=UPI00261E5E7A|nr:uroporphyrinogen-III synthase [Zhongshania sp.]MDF1692731.1 uroporphyrinogen-III synthase [Zhongshania sp.]